MLDDLKYIHEKDAQDALGIATKQPKQLLQDFSITALKPTQTITNIVFAGMGGSALGALLSTVTPGYSVPFEICRQYDIPRYVNDQTLFVASSYSGNTEETLSALDQAAERGAIIAVITGGGKLQQIAEQKGYPVIVLPKAEQPRYAVFYSFKALLQMLRPLNVFAEEVTDAQLAEVAQKLTPSIATLLPEVPTAQNPAKKLAQELMGRSIVVYAGQALAPAAYKWKISFNENAKNVAWMGTYPEFNHNEFIGWSSHPVQKPYAVIDLRSSFDHPRVQKRFELSSQLLSGKRPESHTITAQGDTLLEQLLWTVLMGDFTSIYLGLLNGLNPTPVELVERLKKELGD